MQETTFTTHEENSSEVIPFAVLLSDFVQKHKVLSNDDLDSLFSSLPALQNLMMIFHGMGLSPSIVKAAFIHRSFVHENSSLSLESNEKFEFLGDAVLQILISRKLVTLYPELQEGTLSKLRGALVNGQILARLARVLRLGELLFLGKGETLVDGWNKDSILADALEAFLGVVFHTMGFVVADQCFECILEHFRLLENEDYIHISRLDDFDPKSRLQEETMRLYGCLPDYRAIAIGDSYFEVSVFLNGKKLSQVMANSKKYAEKLLAKQVLADRLYL